MIRTIFVVWLGVAFSASAADQKPAPGPFEKAFIELYAGMSAADAGARQNAQEKWQEICFEAGAPNNEARRAEACALMIAKLGADSPAPARIWLLKQLERIGREESVEAIAAVLNDKDDLVRDCAVRALANNPSPKASGPLVDRLAVVTGAAKIGVINALGRRADPATLTALGRELAGSDQAAAVAAAQALGRLPTKEANLALGSARPNAKGALRRAIGNAQLVHAERLQKIGQPAVALLIYSELNSSEESLPIRLAALRGVILTGEEKGGAIILDLLARSTAAEQAIAIGAIQGLSAEALKSLAAGLDKLPTPMQARVVTAIAARGENSQLPLAVAAASSSDPALMKAGLQALGRMGDATTVEPLLELMTRLKAKNDPLSGTAADSVAQLAGDGINEKLLAVLDAEKSAPQIAVLIGVLERRQAKTAVPALLKATSSTDGQVRNAAFNALKVLAGPEHVAALVDAMLKEKGNERQAVEAAIVAICERIPSVEKRADPVLAALNDRAKGHDADLLPLLGRLGGPEALRVVRAALAGTDAATRTAALTAICHWPDAAANDDLLALAEKVKEPADQHRLFAALVRINGSPSERKPEERLPILNVLMKAMSLTSRDEDRQMILQGIGFVRHLDTLHYVLPYLDQAPLTQAACKAVVELAHSKALREPNKAEFDKALDRVIAICKDNGLVDRAKQYKEGR